MSDSFAADTTTIPPIFKHLAEGKKQTVVVYGTSLTAAGRWTKEVEAWFAKNYPGQVTFFNNGGSGMNSDWGVKNVKKVLEHQPDLVFIEFSYNDSHVKFKMPVEKGAANLDAIVKEIKQARPEAALVLQTMNVPHKDAAISRPDLEAYNSNYRNYAKEHNLVLLDHYPNWLRIKESDIARYEKLVPDGSHPSPAGSLEVTWPTIEAWLEQCKKAVAPAAPSNP